MGRGTVENRNVRSLTKTQTGSYSVTLPIELVRQLSWRERQKLIVRRKGQQLIIEDWPAK